MRIKISNHTGYAYDTKISAVLDGGIEVDLVKAGISRLEILPLVPDGAVVARLDFLFPEIDLTGDLCPSSIQKIIYDEQNAAAVKKLGRGRIF